MQETDQAYTHLTLVLLSPQKVTYFIENKQTRAAMSDVEIRIVLIFRLSCSFCWTIIFTHELKYLKLNVFEHYLSNIQIKENIIKCDRVW